MSDTRDDTLEEILDSLHREHLEYLASVRGPAAPPVKAAIGGTTGAAEQARQEGGMGRDLGPR